MIDIEFRLRKLFKRIEFDRTVFFSLLTRGFELIVGPVTPLLILWKFTPVIQGYYYTFASLIAFRTFIEFGLGTVITQFASHEWARLSLDKQGNITGNTDAVSRLSGICRFAVRWYLIGGTFFVFAISIGGYFFFHTSDTGTVNWQLPWLALSVLTGLSIFFLPIWSLLEGCNQVARVYTFRFIASVVSHLSLWIALWLNAGLWATIITVAIGHLSTVIFLRIYYWRFFNTLLFITQTGPSINWYKDIFPMQWRIAVTWLCGYLGFNLFTPLLFKFHGPIIAGQMGMTWSLLSVLKNIPASWLIPKIPVFGMLIAKKEYPELDRLFWKLTKIVTGVTVLSSLFFWLVIYILNLLNLPIAQRVLSPYPVALFLIAHTVNTITLPMAYYLRAHKKEPLMVLSIIQGLFVGVSNLVLGKFFSATGMAAGYLISVLVLTPLTCVVWYRCRVSWHRD